MNTHPFIPYRPPRLSPEEMELRARSWFEFMNGRRSVREFSPEPVPRELIAWAIRTASTAPSGAHRQPWHFVAISSPEIKRQIRIAAEKEEYQAYEGGRMPPAWREALEPLGTTWEKPFLEIAPWLVVLFEQIHGPATPNSVEKNYYVKESVGIACGMFITAVHQMGLATLTHTPSPMQFLSKILRRPPQERPFALFPIGYPADGAMVPDLRRKELAQVSTWFED